MSVWPEAVWIVKKLEKRFDFQDLINNYTYHLNELNGKVNDLNDRVAQDELLINASVAQLQNKLVTILAKSDSSGNYPDTTEEYGQGTIWLVEV